jgi:AcrR family transcriptional regulator
MTPEEKNARERILQATIAILNEVDEPSEITVRQIADRANVGVGSINYHFQSKETLLNEAVSSLMMEEAARWFQAAANPDVDPVTRLKRLFKETSRIAARYPKLLQVMLAYGFQTGDVTVPVMILPLLREIFGERRTELELRLMALQVVIPIQAIALHPAEFQQFTGFDLMNDQQRNQMIDLLIDNLIR